MSKLFGWFSKNKHSKKDEEAKNTQEITPASDEPQVPDAEPDLTSPPASVDGDSDTSEVGSVHEGQPLDEEKLAAETETPAVNDEENEVSPVIVTEAIAGIQTAKRITVAEPEPEQSQSQSQSQSRARARAKEKIPL